MERLDTEIIKEARVHGVVNPILLSGGDHIDPEIYNKNLSSHWGVLRRVTGEAFLLTERSFDCVNNFLAEFPSRLLRFYLSQVTNDCQITILDLGGGRDAFTAKQLALRCPAVRVTSIDRVAVDEDYQNFTSQSGDICSLGLPDNYADIVYSHQVLPYMVNSRRIEVIREICRVLKPGGSGVIDYSNRPVIQCNLGQISQATQAFDSSVWLHTKSYGGTMLLIAKNPVDPKLRVIICQ